MTTRTNRYFVSQLRSASLLATCFIVGALGCKSQDAAPAPAASASASSSVTSAIPSASAADPTAAADAGAPEPPKLMIPRNAGRAGLMLGAAASLELRDAEKTQKLDTIAKSFKETDGPKDEAKAIHDELVAQVKAGKIDTAKLEPLYVALEKAAKEQREKEVTALDGIYAALGPLERKAMTDHLRKRLASREAHMPKDLADAGSPKEETKRVAERMAKNLGLDEAQQKKVEALLPTDEMKKLEADREEDKKHLEALLVAFEKDGFEAKKLPSKDPKKVRQPFQDQVKLFSQLIPILNPEQREKLAGTMTNARGGRFPGGSRHPMKPGPHGPKGWSDGEP